MEGLDAETERSQVPWWDADKLVFKEVLDSLLDILNEQPPASPRGKALVTRLSEDVAALDQIEGLYEKEIEKIFARLDTRGMIVKRQKWDAYMAHLTSLFTAEDILDTFEPRVVPKTRGAAPKKASSKIIDGTKLPDKTVILTFDDGPHGRLA